MDERPRGVVLLSQPSPCSADPDRWFAGTRSPGSQELAKKVCKQCPYRRACLLTALDNDERHGVWGGLTTEERDELDTSGDPDAPRASQEVA